MIICNKCGAKNPDGATYCNNCGLSIGAPDSLIGVKPLTDQERSAILSREIKKYVRRDFRVISRTDTTTQLVKPKKFSFLWALFWLIMFGVGLIFYLIYYLAKKDEVIYIEVESSGEVTIAK